MSNDIDSSGNTVVKITRSNIYYNNTCEMVELVQLTVSANVNHFSI